MEQFYKETWKNDWFDMEYYNPTARHLQQEILKICKTFKKIETCLDIGCGSGINISHLIKNFPEWNYTGVDLSNEIFDLCDPSLKDKKNVVFKPLDIASNSVKKSYDFVLCNQVLEHIEDDTSAMHNIYKCTKKYLLITVPAGNFNKTSVINGHVRHYSKQKLEELVVNSGFSILKSFEWGFPFHNLYKHTLNFLPEEKQKMIGFGKYGFFKKLLSHLIYILFYFNVFNKGHNIILLAKKVP
tara:strand:- start:3191 stop:3916 length:726 start_codon:yes stop_codon:yes gene_type:complete